MTEENQIKKREEIVRELKQLLGGHPNKSDESKVDRNFDSFIEQRRAFSRRPDVWTLEGYLNHYGSIRFFGLEDELMEQLEIKIRWAMEDDPATFLKSAFYTRFKGHKVVKRVVEESRKGHS